MKGVGLHRRDVVFWFSAPTPYMSDRFQTLHTTGSLDFECWFTRMDDPMRSWDIHQSEMEYPHRLIPQVGIGCKRAGVGIAALAQVQPRVLISFHGNMMTAGSILQHAIPQGKLIYYVERTFDTWIRRTRAKETAKLGLFRLADGFMTPGPDGDEYVRRYAGSAKPIMRLNHVVDVAHFSRARTLRHQEANAIRRSMLGLNGFIFLYVGRLVPDKGIETLIDGFSLIPEARKKASLLIVGDGDKRRYQAQASSRGLTNVRFLDFVQQSNLPEIYALAHAFVFPTRGDPYGLVVDEAMASGLPILSTRSAGEIESRVIDGASGYLFPRDDSHRIAGAIRRIMEDKSLASAMGDHAHSLVCNRDHTFWVEQIEANVSRLGI